jgi:hypothetical protein
LSDYVHALREAQRDLSGNQVKDGFMRQQAGFGFGGAIKKDKTFYYVNAEQTFDFKDNLLNVPQLDINETVPGTNRGRQAALPHARRGAGFRGAKGEPERAQAWSLQQVSNGRPKALVFFTPNKSFKRLKKNILVHYQHQLYSKLSAKKNYSFILMR